jgi:hypothetical protein
MICLYLTVFRTLKLSAAALPIIHYQHHSRDTISFRQQGVGSVSFPKKRHGLNNQCKKRNDLGDSVAKKWIEKNKEKVKLLIHTPRIVSSHVYGKGLEANETI